MQTIWYHLEFYQAFVLKSWADITPMEYGVLLAGVGLIGWLLMRHGAAQ
jgi:hypothetical protein